MKSVALAVSLLCSPVASATWVPEDFFGLAHDVVRGSDVRLASHLATLGAVALASEQVGVDPDTLAPKRAGIVWSFEVMGTTNGYSGYTANIACGYHPASLQAIGEMMARRPKVNAAAVLGHGWTQNGDGRVNTVASLAYLYLGKGWHKAPSQQLLRLVQPGQRASMYVHRGERTWSGHCATGIERFPTAPGKRRFNVARVAAFRATGRGQHD